MVPNAPLAQLFAVQVRTDPKKTGMNGLSTLLVPRGAAGLTVRERGAPFGSVDGQAVTRWHHGTGSEFRSRTAAFRPTASSARKASARSRAARRRHGARP